MNEGVSLLLENASDAQKATHKDKMKKDRKSMLLIHQCVDLNIFEKIIEEEMGKGA